MLELTHANRAARVVGVEPVENFGAFVAARAHLRKEQLAFLRVVDPLGNSSM
jgi:hypothetical protein